MKPLWKGIVTECIEFPKPLREGENYTISVELSHIFGNPIGTVPATFVFIIDEFMEPGTELVMSYNTTGVMKL